MQGAQTRGRGWENGEDGNSALAEWKANLDLLKFYETLKQQRFAHFLTIQTTFLALFALLAKEAIGVFSLLTLAALVLVPIAPLVISFYFMSTSAHASEAAILRLFWWLWIILFSSMLIHFAWYLANPAWRPT